VLCPFYPREELDGKEDVLPTKIIKELENEARIYHHLFRLQSHIIPKFLFCGALIKGGVAYGFATEYCGEVLEHITISQAYEAIHHLNEIHHLGVLHGDVTNLNNLLYNSLDNKLYFIDFGMSLIVDDFKNKKKEWEKLILEEMKNFIKFLEEEIPGFVYDTKENNRNSSD